VRDHPGSRTTQPPVPPGRTSHTRQPCGGHTPSANSRHRTHVPVGRTQPRAKRHDAQSATVEGSDAKLATLSARDEIGIAHAYVRKGQRRCLLSSSWPLPRDTAQAGTPSGAHNRVVAARGVQVTRRGARHATFATLIAAIVTSPAAWIIIAFGQERSDRVFAHAQGSGVAHPGDSLRPPLLLAGAGISSGSSPRCGSPRHPLRHQVHGRCEDDQGHLGAVDGSGRGGVGPSSGRVSRRVPRVSSWPISRKSGLVVTHEWRRRRLDVAPVGDG
jgi:hypothetical protein